MNVSLPPQLKKFVDSKVHAGQYASAAEVVRSALEALRAQDSLAPEEVADLRREAMIGAEQLDRGETAEFTAKGIQALGRKMLAQRQSSATKKKPAPRRRAS